MALIVGHCAVSATGYSPLNMRPHAEVSVNENTKVMHRLGWNELYTKVTNVCTVRLTFYIATSVSR